MNKLFLSSVAMAGASAVAASAVAMPIQSKSEAGTPILSASMVAQFEGGFADNDKKLQNKTNDRESGFVNGRFSEIFFNGELTADNGLVYGAKIHLNTTDRSETLTSGYPGRHYIYLSGGWGSLEFGNWIGADSGLNLCPLACSYKSYGLLDTPYHSYAVKPDGAVSNHINPYWFDQSPKATYYTPVVNGVQAGISYTPTGGGGFFDVTPGPTSAADGEYKDVIGYGAQWKGEFGGTSLGISAIGAQSDDALDEDTANVSAQGLGHYEVTAQVGVGGFQVAGTYWDFGDGGAPMGADQDYSGWAINAVYTFGPYGLELQYATAEQERTYADPADNTESEFVGWGIGLGYSIAPGLKWYGEVVKGEWDVEGFDNPDGEYDSTVGLMGLVLSF